MHSKHPSTAAISEARRLMVGTYTCRKPYVIAYSTRKKRLMTYNSVEQQVRLHPVYDKPEQQWRLVGTYLKPCVMDLAHDIDCFIEHELIPRDLL